MSIYKAVIKNSLLGIALGIAVSMLSMQVVEAPGRNSLTSCILITLAIVIFLFVAWWERRLR